MARSYDSRQFPAGPFVEPRVTPTHRGLKRLGAIGEIVPGDDIEVARAIARIRHPRQRVPPACFHIKLTPDPYYATGDPTVGTPWIFQCFEDVAGWQLYAAELACSVPSSSGIPEVQLRLVRPVDGEDPEEPTDGVDILAVPLTIDESEYFSADADVQYEIDLTKNVVEWGDLIAIDLDVVGTGLRGLTLSMWFGPA